MAESSNLKPQPGSRETSLSPILEGALSNLMVDLDGELQRYRQRRSDQAGLSAPSPQSRFRRAQRSGPQLINLPPTPAAPKGASLRPTPAQAAESLTAGKPVPPPPPPRSVLTAQDLIPYSPMAEDYLESTEALLDTDPTAYITDYGSEPEDRPPTLGRSLGTPLGLGALLLLLVASAGFGYLVTSPQAIDHLRQYPLVRGLGKKVQPPSAAPQTASPEPGSSVPEGLGPDLSQQEFSPLDLNRVSHLPAPTQTPEPSPLTDSSPSLNPLQSTPSLQKPADLPAIAPSPPSRAVAPPRTPVLTPSSRPAPAPTVASPAPSPPAAPVSPTPGRVAPAALSAPPPRPLATPARSGPPAPLAQATAAPAPLQPSRRYYLVVDYSGEASLATARRVVGDAYVRSFSSGAKIQMGAFSQPTAAQNLVQQLQQQGLSAQVVGP
ncbi:MAG: SPOR domain-containing protein [Nodosilinea sp.]